MAGSWFRYIRCAANLFTLEDADHREGDLFAGGGSTAPSARGNGPVFVPVHAYSTTMVSPSSTQVTPRPSAASSCPLTGTLTYQRSVPPARPGCALDGRRSRRR